MARSFYIGHIYCDPERLAHISKRELTEDDVRAAVQWPSTPERLAWSDDPDDPRGPRLLAVGYDQAGRRLKVVLFPVDITDGTWSLCTAFFEV